MPEQQIQPPWFAVRVKPRYEQRTAQMLRGKGYEEFLPLYTERHVWSDRTKSVRLPLFPGYLFCRLDPSRRLPVLTTVGVLAIVGASNGPEPVSDLEIGRVRAIVESGVAAQPWEGCVVGQPLYLERGPLRGLEGTLLETRGHAHLVVSVNLLQRSVCVQIEREWARPIGGMRPAGCAGRAMYAAAGGARTAAVAASPRYVTESTLESM